jgi:lipid-binding SYLF domain-containing protein
MHHFRIFNVCILLTILGACSTWSPPPGVTARNLIVPSAQTVERFRIHKDLKKFSELLSTARGVVILPRVIKAGFFAGGEGGNGVLLTRASDGTWGYPAFFTLGAASFGLQFGVQDTAIVLILRNEGALQSILKYQGKIGADTGATVGVVGVGLEASTTTNLGADIVAFATSNVGAYLGASLEGAVLAKRRDLNEAFYGEGATPETILSGRLKNPEADKLRQVLAKQ